MKRLLLLTLILATAWSFFILGQNTTSSSKTLEIAKLENEIQILNQNLKKTTYALKNEQNRARQETVSSHRTEVETFPSAKLGRIESEDKPDKANTTKSQRSSRFSASFGVASIERVVVLSDSQREELSGLYEQAIIASESESPMKEEVFEESLRDIMGDDLYTDYKAEQEKSQNLREKERNEQRLYTMSRKLNLDQNQEQLAKDILLQAREKFFSNNDSGFRGRMLFYSEAERSENLREYFESSIKAEKYIAENMRSALNDDQYNSLLEMQGTSPRTLFREQMLQTLNAEKESKE